MAKMVQFCFNDCHEKVILQMQRILSQINRFKINAYHNALEELIKEKTSFLKNAKGNFLRFQKVLQNIPDFASCFIDLDKKAITIGKKEDLNKHEHILLYDNLKQLCPWRKGPFNIFGIKVDSEWQSWMKWDRLKEHIGDIKGKRILDIGSNNGYYMFKIAYNNPLMVIGLEPQSSFYFQYLAIQKFLKQDNVFCFPITYEKFIKMDKYFDMVFCMGIIYHQKSPIQMLKSIHENLRQGGKLILETLVINTKLETCLFPKDRYASMRNVYFIPDLLVVESWLRRAGFKDIKCVSVLKTSLEEQRKTKWIQTQTLKDFLDPNNFDKTIEGYPAPIRAIVIANKT